MGHSKGDWAMKFKKENTQKRDFHVSKDKVVQADMMFSNEKYPYIPLKDLKAEAIQIPYKGQRLSMILLLPRPDSSLEELEKSLEKVPDINTVLKFPPLPGKSKVELSLPKFKLETQLDLNDNLKAMGITDMFDESQADFSKMRSDPTFDNLYVSKVVQK